ncbi:MAG: hypothetical protein AAFQ02_07220 [Bacteroidota bacterium]
MTKNFFYLFMVLGLALVATSCDSDNECDTTCPAGQVQLLNCSCATDANTITPHPCPDLTCPAGQGAVIAGNTCSCQALASSVDPCDATNCPEGFICDGGNCIVDPAVTQIIDKSGEISADETWTAGNVYILKDRVTVTNGAKLTIEAGVVVKGEAGTGANASALLVARGSQLMAMGTEAAPIIFTSIADEIMPGQIVSPNLTPDVNGLWGGVIVLGNAPISAANESDEDVSEVQIEGIPTSDANGLYGGTDAADNSGTITYISIRHGGSNIGEGNEINGLTLGGVGSGTTINNVEIVANQDDGIEWFGGDASIDGALVWNCGDDGLDTDQDWNGSCTNFLVVTPVGGSGFELDGPEGSTQRGFHTFDNGALFAGGEVDHLVDWDGSTNAAITNLYIFGLPEGYPTDFPTPIESFGGDGSGTSSAWEVTLPAGAGLDILGDAAGITTEVAVGSQTKGPRASDFPWTWANQSGALGSIGL